MDMQYSEAELKARWAAEDRAASEVNHPGSHRAVGATDQYVCDGPACDWEGNPRYDGPHKARAEWVQHILEHGAEINYPERQLYG